MGTAGPSIRDWQPADAAACAAIYAPYVESTTVSFELEPPSADELTRRFLALRSDGFPVLVAEDAGSVVGYAYAGAFRARAAYRPTVEHAVYVDPGRQRGGVGRVLVESLAARCRAAGFRGMVAVVGDSANQRSIAFHQALGFEVAGILRGVAWKFGRALDIVMLQRRLDADAALPDTGSGDPPGRSRP
jgi:L-amino acid N-acyltransferase YncA